jgi:DNA-binding transcriptional MocR family regulator
MIGAMAFRNAGAQLVDIDVDDEGLRTDQLARSRAALPSTQGDLHPPPPHNFQPVWC